MKTLGIICVLLTMFNQYQNDLFLINNCDLYIDDKSPLGTGINKLKSQNPDIMAFMIIDRNYGTNRVVEEFLYNSLTNKMDITRYSINSSLDTTIVFTNESLKFEIKEFDLGKISCTVACSMEEIMSNDINIYFEGPSSKVHLVIGNEECFEMLKLSDFSELFEPILTLSNTKI